MSVLFDPDCQHRRSIRLRGYDYTQAGTYFVTIVVQDRACQFGEVVDGHMRLNDAGRMVAAEWDALCARFMNIDRDAFVVMPNHIHGVIIITGTIGTDGSTVGAALVAARSGTCGQTTDAIVGAPLVGARSMTGVQTTTAIVGAPLVGAQSTEAIGGNHKGCPYIGQNRRCVQIIDNRCLYTRGQIAGMVTVSRAIVAAQLFRTHRSQRGFLAPHPAIHRGQPCQLDGRP